MRFRAVVVAAAVGVFAATACSGRSGLFRQYEYEEELYIALDGSATVFVNASLPALNALRGTTFDTAPNTQVDRDAVRRYFDLPEAKNFRLNVSLRRNRRFVHVRLDIDDFRALSRTAPFAWSSYSFQLDDDLYVYRQTVGDAAGNDVGDVGWSGRERVGFRLHLPSRVVFHDNNTGAPERGNILVWEQPLSDRARGVPLTMEARMETMSILYRTLWLFGVTVIAVAITFVIMIWWVLRRRPSTAEV